MENTWILNIIWPTWQQVTKHTICLLDSVITMLLCDQPCCRKGDSDKTCFIFSLSCVSNSSTNIQRFTPPQSKTVGITFWNWNTRETENAKQNHFKKKKKKPFHSYLTAQQATIDHHQNTCLHRVNKDAWPLQQTVHWARRPLLCFAISERHIIRNIVPSWVTNFRKALAVPPNWFLISVN